MKNYTILRGLAALALFTCVSSCQDEEFGYTTDQIKLSKYDRIFEQTFGTIDEKQDFSMATLVKANINLSQIEGTSKMNIMTGDPRLSTTRLLGQVMLQDGVGSINFDAIKGNDKVFVTVEQDNKYKVFREYTIVNGMINVGDEEPVSTRTTETSPVLTRAFSSSPSTKAEDPVETCMKYQEFDHEEIRTSGGSQKSLDAWYADVRSYAGQYNASQFFKDESVRHFVQISSIDWENSSLVLKSSATLNDSELISWKGTVKTGQEWIEYVRNNYSQASNYGYSNDNCPFTPESILDYDGSSDGNWWKVTKFIWDDPQLKVGAEKCAAGSIITYNGQTKSLNDWKTDASNNLANIAANTYDGPWENSSFKLNQTDCAWNAPGATYVGLFPESHWELPEGITRVPVYHDNKIKVQYLNGVETGSVEPWLRGIGQKLYGSEGFFCEQNYYWGPKETTFDKTILYGNSDSEKLATMQKIEAGFSITATGGPIELPLIYASTGNLDQFGYVIYDEGQDPLSQPHYVLMDNATPSHNVYYQGHRNGATWVDEPVSFSGTEAYYQFMKNYENGSMKDKDNSPEEMAIYLKEFNTPVYGTSYRLVEFDSSGNASYNITAGKKIVFFLMKVNKLDHTADINANVLYYSLPELNYRVGNIYGGENHNSLTYKAGLAPEGAVKATSWYADGHYYLGFEDGGYDEDLNDIIFWAEGGNPSTSIELYPIKWHMNIDPSGDGHLTDDSDLYWVDSYQAGYPYQQPMTNPTYGDVTFLGWATSPLGDPIEGSNEPGFIEGQTPAGGICYFARWDNEITPVPDPEPMGWIFACEDLGGTFDYDFNDIVWEVQRPDDTHLKVKVLAAGGTMDFALMFGNTTVCKKENAFTSPVAYDDIINAGNGKDGYTPVVNTVSCSASWSIANNKGDFSVLMSPKNGNSWYITSYSKDSENTKFGKAPQIFVVASRYWEWPKEGILITQAYTQFNSWVSNAEITNFWSDKISKNVYSQHLDQKYVNIFVNEQSLINEAGITVSKNSNGKYYEIFDPNMISETRTLCIEVQQGFSLLNNFVILDSEGKSLSQKLNIFSLGGSQVVEIEVDNVNKDQTYRLAFKNEGLFGQIKINRIYFKSK